MSRSIKFVAMAALCAVSTPAFAAANASGSARITAVVPAVCDLSADDFVLNESGFVTGSVQEFCNTSSGYQVLASHRPLDVS